VLKVAYFTLSYHFMNIKELG